jgi:ATP-dependent helicase/nuclease subunit B
VDTLKYQISKGTFEPAFVEMSFQDAGGIEEINVALSEDEKNGITERMKLVGKVDRIDLCKYEDKVYIKVMDFKSGTHSFNMAYLYYGLQLQLVMYMNVAMAVEKKLSPGKEVIPAAILYYHVNDPMVDAKEEKIADDINKDIISKLKMTGLVNADQTIVQMLDKGIISKSDIIPVEIKKDGDFSARSSVATSQQYSAISGFVNRKVREFGKRILDGDIQINPYEDEKSKRQSCTYCAYRSICGYDEKIRGFEKRKLTLSDNDAMDLIMKEDNNGRS